MIAMLRPDFTTFQRDVTSEGIVRSLLHSKSWSVASLIACLWMRTLEVLPTPPPISMIVNPVLVFLMLYRKEERLACLETRSQ